MGKTFSTNNLKIIASVAMFFDHFVTVFFDNNDPLSLTFRIIGRMAAPIFCFFIAQGFNYTSNLNKYIIRLLVLAVISHFSYNLLFNESLSPVDGTSVIWPLAMGLIALEVIKNEKITQVSKLIVLAALCALSYTANWNFIAVLWIVVFGVFHGNFKRQIAGFIVVGMIHLFWWHFVRFGFFHANNPQWFQLGIFLAIPLLAMYSGKPGKKSAFMTWFFYVFYPAHLILLFILKQYTSLAEILEKLY